jgi:hypothetical protein
VFEDSGVGQCLWRLKKSEGSQHLRPRLRPRLAAAAVTGAWLDWGWEDGTGVREAARYARARAGGGRRRAMEEGRVPQLGVPVAASAEHGDGRLGVVEGQADPGVLRHNDSSDEGDGLMMGRAGRGEAARYARARAGGGRRRAREEGRDFRLGVPVAASAEHGDGRLGVIKGRADPGVLRRNGSSDEGDVLMMSRAGRGAAPGKGGLGSQAEELDGVGPDLSRQCRGQGAGWLRTVHAATADSRVVKSWAPS